MIAFCLSWPALVVAAHQVCPSRRLLYLKIESKKVSIAAQAMLASSS
jgi:hypothetical protein